MTLGSMSFDGIVELIRVQYVYIHDGADFVGVVVFVLMKVG